MHKSIVITLLSSIFVAFNAFALTPKQEIEATPLKVGGHYFAYPENEVSELYGKVPEGYEAFYVSHYGRHGSRYLTSAEIYTNTMATLDSAAAHGALTRDGYLLRQQLDTVYAEAEGRAGELSPLGARQHKGIARRMAAAYPAVVADSADFTAVSTIVMRCAHSMFAFVEALKEINPSLEIPRESSARTMSYMNYSSPESVELRGADGPYRKDFKRFRKQKANCKHLMHTFFKDDAYVKKHVDALRFAEDLYYLAVDMQSVDCGVDLLRWFTPEEAYALWEVFNFKFFARYSSYVPADSAFLDNARPLVADILDKAEGHISNNRHGADLRFGHDINLMPLTALLAIEGCHTTETDPAKLAQSYANYRIVPMAANIQFVFMRPVDGQGDLLVSVFLNEKPARLPLPTVAENIYKWDVLKPYLQNLSVKK